MSSPGAPTQRQREIADAVLYLLGRDGFAGLGVLAVANHLGITAGALYRHFPSWDAIFGAALVRAATVLEETIPGDGEHASGLEWLLAFSSARASALTHRRGVILLVFAGPRDSAGETHSDAAKRVADAAMASQARLLSAAIRGLADGSLRPLSPEIIVRTVIAHTLLSVLGGPPGLAARDANVPLEALRALLSPVKESSPS